MTLDPRRPSPTTESAGLAKPIVPDYSPPGVQWTQGGRPSSRGAIDTGYDLPTARQALTRSSEGYEAPDTEFATREQVSDIGKTKVAIAPGVPSPVVPEDLKAPDRVPGFFEGMLGGLVEAFTGVLPGWLRDPVVGIAQGAGQLADIPGEALGHVPINQMFGLEDLEGAFKLMPLTDEKKRVIAAMEADPLEADWYMSQYLRAHAGDYADEKGLPLILANLIRPDATIQERLFMGLGIPAQFVARNVAGVFGRAEELLAADIESLDPALRALRTRYEAGEFGPVGSDEAKRRLLDEMTTAGYAWGNDPFISMLAEMVTDPVIIASFGTGAALGMVRTGTLAQRAAALGRVARGSTDSLVKQAVQGAEQLIAKDAASIGKAFDLQSADSVYKFGSEVERALKGTQQGRDLVQQAEATLSTRQRFLTKMALPIEAAAKVSEVANSPFGFFGSDGAAGAVMRKFARNSSHGAMAAFTMRNTARLWDGVENTTAINEAFGTALAYTQRAMMQNNLTRMVRNTIYDAKGRLVGNAKAPDLLDNPDKVLDGIKDDFPAEAQQTEAFVRRTKVQYEPSTGSLEGDARVREYDRQMSNFRDEAAQKLVHVTGGSIDEARRVVQNADADMLALIDYIHFGRTIRDLIDAQKADMAQVKAGIQQVVVDATQKGAGDAEYVLAETQFDLLEVTQRATLVGPRELTKQIAVDLMQKVERAKDTKAKMDVLQPAIDQYEFLHQNLYEKVRITTDEDLIDRTMVLLKDGLDNDRFVTTLGDDSLPPHLLDLKNDLQARGAMYEIGLAPAIDKRWAPIRNAKDELVGYYPWMDVRVTPEEVKAPTKFDRIRQSLASPIRGEYMMQESRRKFIGKVNKDYGMSRGASIAVWDAIRQRAREERITMRGFSPETFNAIMEGANISAAEKQKLGMRGLSRAVAYAMEGDLAMVGLTTKITGKGKTRTSGYMGNPLGVLAENVYPRVRFGRLNPIFQMQEFVEPYFFNFLRGLKPGFRFGQEQLDFHNLLDEWNMAEKLADGFEAREHMMSGQWVARNAAGPNTPASAIIDDMPHGPVGTAKRTNYMRLVKQRFGEEFHRIVEKMAPGEYARMKAHYDQWDIDVRGGKGNLSKGDIAELWLKHKGAMNADSQWLATHHYDGAVPDQFGNIRGINSSYLAKQFGHSDAAAIRQAAQDPTNTAITEWSVREQLVEHGFTHDYARRAWAVLNGPTVEEVLDGFEGRYSDPESGRIARDLADALITRGAITKGISKEEYVARKFTTAPRWVDRNARPPYKAYFQLADRELRDNGLPPLERGDERLANILNRATTFTPENRHPSLNQHVTAHARNVAGEPTEFAQQVVDPVNVDGFEVNPGLTTDDFIRINLEVLGEETFLAVAEWYPEIAPMFGGIAFGLPESTILEYARLMDEHVPALKQPDGKTLEQMVKDGESDVVREEIAARMIMAWGATQVQTSPRDGFQFVMNIMDSTTRGERIGAKGIGSFEDQKAQFKAMLVDLDEALNVKGLGAKLQDFIDSILGNTERSFMRLADNPQMFRDGVPMQPGAMDIWMGRALGFIDNPMIGYLAKRIETRRGLSPDEAFVQAQKELGFVARKSWKEEVLDPDTGEKVMKDVDEPLEQYRARIRQFETDNGLEEGSVKEVWDGSPSPAEYEHMLYRYNSILNDLNDRKFMWDRRGGRPWTMADIQAVEWMRIQYQLDIDPGGPNNMFYQNSAQVSFETKAVPGTPLGDAVPWQSLTDDALDLVTEDMSILLADIIQEETGVVITRSAPGRGGYLQDDGNYAVSANTHWTMLGSDEAIDDALMSLSLLTQNERIFATKPSGRGSERSGPGKVWVTDFVPEDRNPLVIDALGRWLDGRQGTPETRTPYEQRALEGAVPEGSGYDVVDVDPERRGDFKPEAKRFAQSVADAKRDHPYGAAVTAYKPGTYGRGRATLIASKDGRAGVAVTPEGDLISVHKHPDSTVESMKPLIAEAASRATTLDAYDIGGVLPDLYAPYGFRVVGRLKFDRQYAPDGWDYAKLGEPDVVFMVKDIDGRTDALAVPPKDAGGYESIRDSVPVYADYDELAKVQKEMRNVVNRRGRSEWKWNGHTIASDQSGNVVRTAYLPDKRPGLDKVTVPQGSDLAALNDRAPIPDDIMGMLQDGSWAREAGLDRDVPVTVNREVHFNKTIDNQYRQDRLRAEERIRKGEDPTTVNREEIGRAIQQRMRDGGRGTVADSMVSRHMDAVREYADAAAREYDQDAWGRGRGREAIVGAERAKQGEPARLQRGRRNEWIAATKWSRDRDTSQRVASGNLRGRAGSLTIRETRPDATVIPHELFHFFADDLDPSGVAAVHDAFFASDAGKRYVANGGKRPTGPDADNHLIVEAEEWAAAQFEEYMATGLAPGGSTTMAAIFNDYENWYGTTKLFNPSPDPALDGVFGKMNPDVHSGPRATYNVDEYRILEALRMAFQRAEEEAFRVHYYKRGRSWLERSVNHPYLGMYPVSYMWGKVLPEMVRFLTNKPFGQNAPFAGLQMANHVYEAIQLELNTDDGVMADFVERYPELLRFMLLMVPGTPWDLPVNAPAWTRRLVQDAWTGRESDYGAALSDTISYAFGPGRVPRDLLEVLGEGGDMMRDLQGLATGTYQSNAAREAEERVLADQRRRGVAPPEEQVSPRLDIDGALQ